MSYFPVPLQNNPAESLSDPSSPQQINDLKATQMAIQNHINKLAELNTKFHKRQEESFLITFSQVMDRMAEELMRAKIKYQNIDIQIKKSKIFNRLQEQVSIYKKENEQLKKNISILKLELSSRKETNQQLKIQVLALKNKLRAKSVVSNQNTIVLKKLKPQNRDQEELEMPQINFRSTVRKMFFKLQDKKQSNSSRGFNNTSLNVKRSHNKSLDIGSDNLQLQIQKLWKFQKKQSLGMSSKLSGGRQDFLDNFVNSTKVREVVKRFLAVKFLLV